MEYRRLDGTSCFRNFALAREPAPLDAEAVRTKTVPAGGGLRFNWAAGQVSQETATKLGAIAEEQELVAKYRALASGEVMNTGERRRVLHHLLRGEIAGKVIVDGKDMRAFYEGERSRFSDFAIKVRDGAIRGSTGAPFATVVQIGIGGSDLGPRAMYLAMKGWARAEGLRRIDARFISNVDPDDAAEVMDGLDLASTLFVLVSKSGTTQETLANETLVRRTLERAGLDPKRHFVAVTSETSPLARNPEYVESFYMDDSIGGRYSSTSAVGGVALSIAFGPEAFAEFLAGAAEADRAALAERITDNAAMLDAMLGVYYRLALGCRATAVLPYSQALVRFAAHLQQLDMESNGKTCDRAGRPVDYPTGPVLFGEPGTNGQHSFYQLLHQGSDVVPLQFVGFSRSQSGLDVEVEGSLSQDKLNANLAAQIVAFARGKDDQDANRRFPGGRPSTLIHGERLVPRALGALLAHFENKVMFQGFAWNLNSFDQEGVQLGKTLAKKALSGASGDPALDGLCELLSAGAARK